MEEWQYPDSRVHQSHIMGGRKFKDLDVTSPANYEVLLTPDDFGKVWAFYEKKCNLPATADKLVTERFSDSASRDGVTLTVFDDKVSQAFEGPKSETLQARGFVVNCPRYTLTGFIYRSRDSDATCIELVYRPNKDYLGLARLHLPKQ